MKSILPVVFLLLGAGLVRAQPMAEAPEVLVAEARVASFPLVVEALGNAAANESVEIRPVISATLTRIEFEEGQQVQAGAVLARLENVEALADVAAARATLAESDSQFRRLSELYKTKAVAESQLNEITARRDADQAALAAAEARLSHTVVRAPFTGQLGLRRVSPGSLVGPMVVITTLDDTRTIKLDFDVPEVFLARLETGLEVTARSAAWPDEVFHGRVASVDTRVDPVSRSVKVRALLDNESGHLRAGMFLTVSLFRQDIESLMVPEEAIVPERSQQFVWVVGADGTAEYRVVRTARRRPGEVEILDGLQPGEQVIVEGTQKARPGAPVKARPRS